MTYNKSEIMKNAWQIARTNAEKINKRLSVEKPVSFFMNRALEISWSEAKKEMQEKLANAEAAEKSSASTKKRYIELAEVAEKNNLNHGKTWIADSYNIDQNSLHPSWEGELVCYVYAA